MTYCGCEDHGDDRSAQVLESVTAHACPAARVNGFANGDHERIGTAAQLPFVGGVALPCPHGDGSTLWRQLLVSWIDLGEPASWNASGAVVDAQPVRSAA